MQVQVVKTVFDQLIFGSRRVRGVDHCRENELFDWLLVLLVEAELGLVRLAAATSLVGRLVQGGRAYAAGRGARY